MVVPESLLPYLVLELAPFQVYGLFFLLGSFTVAALSDLKHLSAQREFVEVWTALLVALLAFDVYAVYAAAWSLDPVLVVKWGLIGIFGLLSHHRVGVLFHLARGDVLACAAACALLPAVLVPVFWLLLKLLAVVVGWLLGRGYLRYPFMPVVTVNTVVVLALGRWGLPRLAA